MILMLSFYRKLKTFIEWNADDDDDGHGDDEKVPCVLFTLYF